MASEMLIEEMSPCKLPVSYLRLTALNHANLSYAFLIPIHVIII